MNVDKNMKIKILHNIMTFISWGILIICLIFLAGRWHALPEIIGVHFYPPTGEFDLYDKKSYSLYPYVIGFPALLILEIGGILTKRLKSGMKINAEGERKFKIAVCLLLDATKVCMSVFWVNWAVSVIWQKSLNTKIALFVSEVVRIAFVLFFISMIVIRIKNKETRSSNNGEGTE